MPEGRGAVNENGLDFYRRLAEAMKKGGADKEKTRDALENLKGFAGTGGVFNYSPADHTGLDINGFEMLTVKGGKFVLYKK